MTRLEKLLSARQKALSPGFFSSSHIQSRLEVTRSKSAQSYSEIECALAPGMSRLLLPGIIISRLKGIVSTTIYPRAVLGVTVVAVAWIEGATFLPHPLVPMPLILTPPVVI